MWPMHPTSHPGRNPFGRIDPGLITAVENDTTCCYALPNKVYPCRRSSQ
jgi:hypothetical protein